MGCEENWWKMYTYLEVIGPPDLLLSKVYHILPLPWFHFVLNDINMIDDDWCLLQ